MLSHIRSAPLDGCKAFSNDDSWKSLETADSEVLFEAGPERAARRGSEAATILQNSCTSRLPGQGVRGHAWTGLGESARCSSSLRGPGAGPEKGMKMMERLSRCGVSTGRQDRSGLCIWNDEDPGNVDLSPGMCEGGRYGPVQMPENSTRKKEQPVKLERVSCEIVNSHSCLQTAHVSCLGNTQKEC